MYRGVGRNQRFLINANFYAFFILQAFDEEELDDPSSESETGQLVSPTEAGFNFNVPAESFLPADQIREDSPVLSPSSEKMIISVELSNKETLEVYSPQPPPTQDDEGGGGGGEGGGNGGPLVVAVSVPNDAAVAEVTGSTENHNSLSTVATVTVEPEEVADESVSAHTCTDVEAGIPGTHSSSASAHTKVEVSIPESQTTSASAHMNVEDCIPETQSTSASAHMNVKDGTPETCASAHMNVEHTLPETQSIENEQMSTAAAGSVEMPDASPVLEAPTESSVASKTEEEVDKTEKERGEEEDGTTDEKGGNDEMEEGAGEGVVNMQVEGGMSGEGGVGKSVSEAVTKLAGIDESSPPAPEEATVVEDMELDSSMPLRSPLIEEHSPAGDNSKEDPAGNDSKVEGKCPTGNDSKVEEEGEGEVECAQQTGEDVKRSAEETEPNAEVEETAPAKLQVSATPSCDGGNVTEQTEKEEEREKPEEQNSEDVEVACEGELEVSGKEEKDVKEAVETASEEKAEVTVGTQETVGVGQIPVGAKSPSEGKRSPEGEKSPEKENEGEAEQDQGAPVDMEIDEMSERSEEAKETAAPTAEREGAEQHTEEEEGSEGKEPSTAATAEQDDGQQNLELQPPENSTLPAPSFPSPGPETSTETADLNMDIPSSSAETVAEEVSEGGMDSGHTEVAVLVHAEEDDLSVFSTEAAEAQKIASSREKERGKARESVRDRDRDRDKSKHRRTTASSASSLPSSKQQSARVDEGTGSNASSRNSSEAAARPSPVEETKHKDGEGTEVSVL